MKHFPKKEICLDVKQAHYLCHVMRLKTGDKIICFNGQEGDWIATLKQNKKNVSLILESQVCPQNVRKSCALCLSLIKRDPLNYALQKATELGVAKIYLVQAERSVREKVNMERLKSIIIEACEQCERNDIPELLAPQPLEKVLKETSEKFTPVFLSERGQTSKKKLNQLPAFFIGPEGGWTEKEIKLFSEKQILSWHLGNTILRAETAALTTVALWQYKEEIKILAI